MKSDRDKWNKRFGQKSELGEPEPFVIDNLDFFTAGRLLDLAGGAGRNGHFLADKDFQVTIADISDVALKKVQEVGGVQTLEVDLDSVGDLVGEYENILMSYFKPSPELLSHLPGLLTSGGRFLMGTFNDEHARQTDFPESYCLKEGELRTLKGLNLVGYKRGYRGRNVDVYKFSKT